MSVPESFTQVILQERPEGEISSNTFKVVKASGQTLQEELKTKSDHALIKLEYFSLDPAMRGWISDRRSYLPPVAIGSTMRGSGIAKVLAVGNEVTSLKVGDEVIAFSGWTEYAVLPVSSLTPIKLPPGASSLDFLGVLGLVGLTAYFGLLEIGQVKEGDVLVVSGAAGATGSVACQLGKIFGAKVYAIAGSDEKCEWLEKELGVIKTFNYKSPTFEQDFKQQVPHIDVYYDNVGGDILNLCLGHLNKYARIIMCGAISGYNTSQPKGPSNYIELIMQSAKMQGFIVTNYMDKFQEAREKLAKWLGEGKIQRRFHIKEGLENAPQLLREVFDGKNTGKAVVRTPGAPDY